MTDGRTAPEVVATRPLTEFGHPFVEADFALSGYSRESTCGDLVYRRSSREIAIIEKLLYTERVEQGGNPRVATISWEGDSKNILNSWPKSIRSDFGVSLREMQHGRPPKLDVRPMQSIGDGVFDLKDSDESAWYRMIYLARKNDVIFVLDCFEKDSRKTEKHDIRRATARFKQVRQRLMEERKNAKHKEAN